MVCDPNPTSRYQSRSVKGWELFGLFWNADLLPAAPFQWAAIFHKEDINFTHGHHDLEWYDPTSKSIRHQLPCKVRCSFCHSPIMDEGRNMVLLFPTLIKFRSDEERENFKPR